MAPSETSKVILFMQKEREEVSVVFAPGDRVMDLLDRVDVPVDGALAFREGVPVPLDAEVEDGLVLSVIIVASGG